MMHFVTMLCKQCQQTDWLGSSSAEEDWGQAASWTQASNVPSQQRRPTAPWAVLTREEGADGGEGLSPSTQRSQGRMVRDNEQVEKERFRLDIKNHFFLKRKVKQWNRLCIARSWRFSRCNRANPERPHLSSQLILLWAGLWTTDLQSSLPTGMILQLL